MPPRFNGFQFKFSIGYVIIMLIAVAIFNLYVSQNDDAVIPFSTFKDKIRSGEIKRVEMDQNNYVGYQQLEKKPSSILQPRASRGPSAYRTVPVYDPTFTALLDEKGIVYASVARQGNSILSFMINWLLPLALMFLAWRLLSRRMGNPGGNVLAFGQNKAMIVAEGGVKTRFVDVAGVDEAKAERVEVVDFLKSPKKYTDIGGKIPYLNMNFQFGTMHIRLKIRESVVQLSANKLRKLYRRHGKGFAGALCFNLKTFR